MEELEKGLKLLHSSEDSLVFHGKTEEFENEFTLKVPNGDFPSISQINRFNNEFEILSKLKIPGVRKVIKQENKENKPKLFLEFVEGQTLKSLFAGIGTGSEFSLKFFLEISIKITRILADIHKEQIIHRDINSYNILIDRKTNEVKFIDFGLASKVNLKTQSLNSEEKFEGTIHYISPEQTGRMNRNVDHRTDLYSLGITFYEMLTGNLPFYSDDPMEIIHEHLAKIPPTPDQTNPHIPPILSEIILKLISKNAEERYQSAEGLLYDLENCLKQIEINGKIGSFPLASQDFSEQLNIPQKLFGRETEIQLLLNQFQQAHDGEKTIAFVSGYSGVGKSTLINELQKPISVHNGHLIKGKYDSQHRNTAYFGIISAFKELTVQLLGLSEPQINKWKERILNKLGNKASIIIEVIPELKLIIGDQPPLEKLGPLETQNRFNLTFQRFMEVFVENKQTLVLVLDDLQWIDQPSISLLRQILNDKNLSHFLFIGAYRENEVNQHHPVSQLIEELPTIYYNISTIQLQPLDMESLNNWMSETFSSTTNQETRDFTALVFMKTEGNPFYVKAFLQTLYEENILRIYNPEKLTSWDSGKERIGRWIWEKEAVKSLPASENLVDFMAGKIQKLPEVSRQLITIASCFGLKFRLKALADILEKGENEIFGIFYPILSEGLVWFSDSTYSFIHDKIQEAAYNLLSVEEREKIHYKIGKVLLSHEERDNFTGKSIFEITHHLNLARKIVEEHNEKQLLADLNFQSAIKARNTSAAAIYFNYCKQTISLLPENTWKLNHKKILKIYEAATESAYMAGMFDEMDYFAELFLQNSTDLLDQVKIYHLLINKQLALNAPLKGLEIGKAFLKKLGVSLPKKPGTLHILTGFLQIKLALLGKKIPDLIHLPHIKNEKQNAIIDTLGNIGSPALIALPELLPIIVFEQVKRALKYGSSPAAADAFSTFGIILSGFMDEYNNGYEMQKLSIKLVDQLSANFIKGRVMAAGVGANNHWKEPFSKVTKDARIAYQLCLESGDLEFGAYNAYIIGMNQFFEGTSLDKLKSETNYFNQVIKDFNQEGPFNWNNIYRVVIQNLRGESETPSLLQDDTFNAELILSQLKEKNEGIGIFQIHLGRLYLNYIFGNFGLAFEQIAGALPQLENVSGMQMVPQFYFYSALTCFSLAGHQKGFPPKAKKYIKNAKSKFKKWAKLCPENYGNKLALILAEEARLAQKFKEAITHYENAINLSKSNQLIQEEALGYELFGRFWLARKNEETGEMYMRKAFQAYRFWGAHKKAEAIEIELNEKLTNKGTKSGLGNPLKSIHSTSNSLITTNNLFNFLSILKVNQLISEEVKLSSLLDKMLDIVLENVGASRGVLLINENDNWKIIAEKDINNPKESIFKRECIDFNNDQTENLPLSIVNFIRKSLKSFFTSDAKNDHSFGNDPYIKQNEIKSIIALPLKHKNSLTGILYLENNLTHKLFTDKHLEMLELLSFQMAVSLDNALLYENLEKKVKERTIEIEKQQHEISSQNQRLFKQTEILEKQKNSLTETLKKLQNAQAQLVNSEKMASLGILAAGIAHEINNPINFISAGIVGLQKTFDKFFLLMEEYEKIKIENVKEQLDKIEALKKNMSYEELKALVKKVSGDINIGASRTTEIIKGLRSFSRSGEGTLKITDIHECLDSTLLLVRNQVKNKILIQKNYGQIPRIECYEGKINQVFMNLITNGIQAIDGEGEISITTFDKGSEIGITIQDTGSGIPEDVRKKIFQPFFTTKEVGKGTGLGLSIALGIIESHQGSIQLESVPGEGTSFTIFLPKKFIKKPAEDERRNG
ncbi:ATP-binding sensor histidine kinase [Flexithrix dorotheae]|uniref:ATP-binding sensor histidine kinase n=1 Tax=Flexithrix dorotheae TaxID=70993 RepID=UPI0003778A08|nr:ATP-binding sensor histidine kinase [Flexithrix dorotheae]